MPVAVEPSVIRANLKKWWIWLPVVWMLLIFCFSSGVIFAGDFTQTVGSWLPIENGVEKFRTFWFSSWWVWTKGFHVLEFALLTWLAFHGALKGLKWPFKKSLLTAVLAAFFYACFDEWHQTFVPGRGGLVSDVLIDCLGITLSTIAILVKTRRPQTKSAREPKSTG